MVQRSGYIPEFVDFWVANPAVEKIWMSIFTPQWGAANVECLTADERRSVVETLLRVREDHPKLDMLEGVIKVRFGRSRWRGGRYRVFGGGSLCGMMQELDCR